MLPHSKLVTLTTLTFKGYDTMSLCLREIRKEEPVVDSVVVASASEFNTFTRNVQDLTYRFAICMLSPALYVLL